MNISSDFLIFTGKIFTSAFIYLFITAFVGGVFSLEDSDFFPWAMWIIGMIVYVVTVMMMWG